MTTEEIRAAAGELAGLDPVFATMAAMVGNNIWGLANLTMTEKTILCLSSDLCHPHLGRPFAMHIQMARAQGVSPAAIREMLRHFGPYVGYPILVPAFAQLGELGVGVEEDPEPVASAGIPPELGAVVRRLTSIAPGLAEFTAEQLAQRWARPHLSVRERAIACIAVDIHRQTLGESFRQHVAIARGAGADQAVLDDLLRGIAEFGLARAWNAAEALATLDN